MVWAVIQNTLNLEIFKPILKHFPEITLIDICKTIRHMESHNQNYKDWPALKWIEQTYIHLYKPLIMLYDLPASALDAKIKIVFNNRVNNSIKTKFKSGLVKIPKQEKIVNYPVELNKKYLKSFIAICQQISRTEMYSNYKQFYYPDFKLTTDDYIWLALTCQKLARNTELLAKCNLSEFKAYDLGCEVLNLLGLLNCKDICFSQSNVSIGKINNSELSLQRKFREEYWPDIVDFEYYGTTEQTLRWLKAKKKQDMQLLDYNSAENRFMAGEISLASALNQDISNLWYNQQNYIKEEMQRLLGVKTWILLQEALINNWVLEDYDIRRGKLDLVRHIILSKHKDKLLL